MLNSPYAKPRFHHPLDVSGAGSEEPASAGDRRLAFFGADFVDDLQHALAIGAELHAEFGDNAAVVDHEVAGALAAAGFVVERDLRIGEKLAHDVGEVAEADRVAAGVVDGV